jgi:hypothetical protein
MKKVKIFGKSIPLFALVAIAAITLVAASTIIYSNVVSVTIVEKPEPVPGYELTLAAPLEVYLGEAIPFTGSLTFEGNAAAGLEINIYETGDIIIPVATTTTLADGTFAVQYPNTLALDTYTFEATYLAPD